METSVIGTLLVLTVLSFSVAAEGGSRDSTFLTRDREGRIVSVSAVDRAEFKRSLLWKRPFCAGLIIAGIAGIFVGSQVYTRGTREPGLGGGQYVVLGGMIMTAGGVLLGGGMTFANVVHSQRKRFNVE